MDDIFDIATTGTLQGRLRPHFEKALPEALRDQTNAISAALAAEGLFAIEQHRAINASLTEDNTWYVVKQSDFDWLTWATTIIDSPIGFLKQLLWLARYRKRRIQLNDTQARIMIALLDQPEHSATAGMLEAALGARYGLTAPVIKEALATISTLRRADGAPGNIVVRDGEKWRAVDL